MTKRHEYYKITKDRQHYIGIRYFKFNWNEEQVVQVIVFPGEEKRGKGPNFGICLISKLNFMANYLGSQKVVPATLKEYKTNFDKVVKALK